MRSYYFNLKGNGEDRRSDTPVQFASLAVAKEDVLQGIRDMIAAAPGEWQFGTLGLYFEICDESGVVLDIVPFRDALVLH